jgi:hypothetical protein
MTTLWVERIYLNLFYYFMILLKYNNVVILSLIISFAYVLKNFLNQFNLLYI